MKAYGGRIIVKPTEVKQRTTTGLYIPNADDQSQIISGTVVSVGEWAALGEGSSDTGLTVGSVVYFNKFGSFKLSEDGVEYYSVKDDDVLGIAG
jgi:co-chaperonin GroES (HSP10)